MTVAAAPPATEPATRAPAPPVGSEEMIVPTFDIVRVEPTGETVVAGQAAPGSTVDVMDGAEAVATAKANERGEWAIAIEKPLKPGTHDLAVRTTSEDKSVVTLSDQRIAVAVPESRTEQPLVVLNTPGAPSEILQMPPGGAGAPVAATAPAPATTAEATPAKSGGGEAVSAAQAVPAPGASPANAPAPGEAKEPVAAIAPTEAPASKETAASSGSAMTGAGGTTAPSTETASAKPAEPAPATPGQAKDVASAAVPETAGGRDAASASRPAAEARPPEEAPKPEPAVAVAAVEADTAGSLYIAGTATTGEPVRVYLDGAFLGEAKPTEGGTWLLEVTREVPPGQYAVRADQVDSSGAVIVRAEVPFEREIDVATLRPVVAAATGSEGGGAASATGQLPALQTVIIKRGDNLWRLSRSMYGKGIRYSTLYQANRDQIRNPRWIYPGQVFVVPTSDMNWKN